MRKKVVAILIGLMMLASVCFAGERDMPDMWSMPLDSDLLEVEADK